MSASARQIVYKTVGEVALALHVFEPPRRARRRPCAAIVFFFGNGWVGGGPAQFFPQCEHLASRGMVSISAEYRVGERHGTSARECVTDGKSAVRWVRAHAAELGVDPCRIAAGGGSAGGHVAACAALIEGLDEPHEDPDVSSKPDALVLFNPVVDTTRPEARAARCGPHPEDISPVHHVRKNLPPCILLHGTDDTVVPLEEVERFTAAMKREGNVCQLVTFEGQAHAFFNYRDGSNPCYGKTLAKAEAFLRETGFLRRRRGAPS